MISTTSKTELLACILLGLGTIVRVPIAILIIFVMCLLQMLIDRDTFEEEVRAVWDWGLKGKD